MSAAECTCCGAMVDLPEDQANTSCSFCGSPLVNVAAAEAAAIDLLVPFAIKADRARDALKQWLATRYFAPEAFRKAALSGKLSATFVPMYAFNGETASVYESKIGIEYKVTTTDSEGKSKTETRTEWFTMSGKHGSRWVRNLVSASRGVTEPEANELEPFDLGEAVAWRPDLIAGTVSELPSIPRDEARETAHQELKDLARRAIEHKLLPGDSKSVTSCSTEVTLEAPELIMMPVWVGVVSAGENAVRVLVNGQTSEVVGAAPTSYLKVGLLILFILLVVAGIVAGAQYL
ncbi:MAG: hypothetical protein ACON5B_12365 [Myxococcota bacterium]